jgi:hypothetical protein
LLKKPIIRGSKDIRKIIRVKENKRRDRERRKIKGD